MDHRSGSGGFHGYRKHHHIHLLSKTTTTSSSSSAEIRLSSEALPATEMNHNHNHIRASATTTNNNNNGKVLSHHHHHHHHHHEIISNMNNGNGNGNGNGNQQQCASNNNDQDNNECTVREQDRFMPIANVIRIMRKILPPHAKISDDAKETIQECVSEYISFITGEANERCQREQRKTITAEDVLWAMSKLGFDDYIEPLTLYLHRYRELEGERGSIRTCEPLLKLTRATMDQYAASFGPVFHIGPPPSHQQQPSPYYGGSSVTVNGYLKETTPDHHPSSHSHPSTAAASNSVTSFEPYAHAHHK